jgi:hypothetical protein
MPVSPADESETLFGTPVAPGSLAAILNPPLKITIRQLGRWRWQANVNQGRRTIGGDEYGGIYAFTRERCIAKALRVKRRYERAKARAVATEETIEDTDAVWESQKERIVD